MTTTAKDDVVVLCDRLAEAHRARDADAIIACYAADATIYSLAPPLGERGMDREAVAGWLATWSGPITIDAADVQIVVGDDIAWSTALNRMRGTKTDGETVDMWFRTTLGFRRTGGGWRIAHDHSSVPFYMDGSYRAATDLTPSGAGAGV